jgi:hypothetical protein
MSKQFTINAFIAAEGGYFAGRVRIGDAVFGVITAPKDGGELTGPWHTAATDIEGARSYFDSRANTVAMAEAGSEIARQALAASINGHSDWVIPARDVLELLYRAHKPTTEANYTWRSGDNPSSIPAGYPHTETAPAQSSSEAFQASGQEAFADGWYWSSTQRSAHFAWDQNFGDGTQDLTSKSFEARVRLVRLIQLDA